MKFPLIVFGVILLVIILAKWYKNRPVKESAPAKENGKTDTSKKKKSFPFGTIITWVIIAAIVWFGYRYFSERAGVRERQTITRELSVWESIPLCAGDEYDFSDKNLPAEVEVNFSSDCVTAVKLPFRADFRIKPDARVKIRFINGTEIIDGPEPSSQNWVGKGQGRELFKVYGLNEAGILKISLEKRT